MSVSLDNRSRLAGYRPSVFKNALRSYLRTASPSNLIDLTSVFPLRRDGAIVFEECIDRDLIDIATLRTTKSGEIIARAKAQKRTPRAKADAILEGLLDRADKMNADDETISQVDEIWLFGSLMRREATVGDIDVAIVTSRKKRFASNHEAREQHAEAEVARISDAPSYWSFPWEKENWLQRRALYGPRRHPLLAGAQEGITELVSLGVPCRLIYDRKRGGRIDNPISEKHPDSRGRSKTVEPPAEMPDLTPTPIRPMDGRWVAGYSSSGHISPFDIFRGWTDDAHRLFPDSPDHLRVLADDCALGSFPWEPRRLKQNRLDGRASLLVVASTDRRGVSVVLNRRIETSAGRWILHADFSDVDLYRSRKYVELTSVPPIAAIVALILAVDAERMIRRASELSIKPKVEIHVSSNGLCEDLKKYLVQPILDFLILRAVDIEPTNYESEIIAEIVD